MTSPSALPHRRRNGARLTVCTAALAAMLGARLPHPLRADAETPPAGPSEIESPHEVAAPHNPGQRQMNFSLQNTSALPLRADCVQLLVEKLCTFIDENGLDPVRTEIFSGSPIVRELLNNPHVKVVHAELTILASLRDGADIVTIDKLGRYALFRPRSPNDLPWKSCLGSSQAS